MGYLGTHNDAISGNTFRMYLSDYGRSTLGSGSGILESIEQFGLGDSDIDYRRFVSGGTCDGQTSLSSLTEDCFYDVPDMRGGDPKSVKRIFGVTQSTFIGPRTQTRSGVISLHNTSLGVAPTNKSTLWAKYKEPISDTKIEEPNSGEYATCWKTGDNITKFYPTYCITCADFNGDGVVDFKDLITFLNLMGTEGKIGSELVGDFNGDGKVDKKDLMIFIDCLKYNGKNILKYCTNKEIYCLLCKHLGSASLCNGDCLKCI